MSRGSDRASDSETWSKSRSRAPRAIDVRQGSRSFTVRLLALPSKNNAHSGRDGHHLSPPASARSGIRALGAIWAAFSGRDLGRRFGRTNSSIGAANPPYNRRGSDPTPHPRSTASRSRRRQRRPRVVRRSSSRPTAADRVAWWRSRLLRQASRWRSFWQMPLDSIYRRKDISTRTRCHRISSLGASARVHCKRFVCQPLLHARSTSG